MKRILGISAFYHDSAACLTADGQIAAAAQEERFSRVKHDAAFPERAVQACLRAGGCSMEQVDCVVFYEKPFVKFERLLDTYLRHCPKGWRSYSTAIPSWLKEKLWIKDVLKRKLDFRGEILFADHHESHAASAFYPSPFQRAAIITVDGVGEWSTATLGVGEGAEIRLTKEIRFPHSLGLLYTAFTYYLGFRVNSGEYKVMGLAPYGTPRYMERILEGMVSLNPDGSFSLDPGYFDYEKGLTMIAPPFEEFFGAPRRAPESELTQLHRDVAASVQKVVEEAMLRTARHWRRESDCANLCLAGGVALNCVANGRILREAGFDEIWIQPAAGDAGGALGAALAVWHRWFQQPRRLDPLGHDAQRGSLLGTSYGDEEIRSVLEGHGAVFQEMDEEALLEATADSLASGSVAGWFQGRMEFGPRALGARSILADPRGDKTRDRVNLRIKFREAFRPFAPAVLEDKTGDYFELDRPSPYMLLVGSVRPELRDAIPSVTHVDGSARIQTVNRDDSPDLYKLLEAFYVRTGCPVLLNTSFNVRGEPMVESPEQAFQCFMRTGLDLLAMGRFLLYKDQQPTGLE